MRKAVWGAAALGVSALAFGTPIRESPMLHRLWALFGLAGYLLVSLDPPVRTVQQRNLMIAGIVASLVAVILFSTGTDMPPFVVLGRILGVASIALPVWLFAGPLRSGFIAAGVLAAATIIDALENAGGVATSLQAYVAALSCLGVAFLLQRPTLLTLGEKKPPRVVVASNIVTYSTQEKARILARLEQQYASGEIPEHVYLDKKQELEGH